MVDDAIKFVSDKSSSSIEPELEKHKVDDTVTVDKKQSDYNNDIQRFEDKLQNKPFWIWNVEEHKQADIITKGNCCFNHIIGLPTKDGLEPSLMNTTTSV